MTAITTSLPRARPARQRTRSMQRDRVWAVRWSYAFLILFAAFFLLPPFYMLITSLKTSAEISAATNPWWVFHPTLSNYAELLGSNEYLRFFFNSAAVARIGTMKRETLAPSGMSLPSIPTRNAQVAKMWV